MQRSGAFWSLRPSIMMRFWRQVGTHRVRSCRSIHLQSEKLLKGGRGNDEAALGGMQSSVEVGGLFKMHGKRVVKLKGGGVKSKSNSAHTQAILECE